MPCPLHRLCRSLVLAPLDLSLELAEAALQALVGGLEGLQEHGELVRHYNNARCP